MIRNGLFSLAAVSIDGVDVEVGGVLILRDGSILGGEARKADAISSRHHAALQFCGKWRQEPVQCQSERPSRVNQRAY